MQNTIVFDTELLAGRFFFGGRVVENRNLIRIWGDEKNAGQKLQEVLDSGCLFVSFNGIKFDLPVIAAVIKGLPYVQIKKIADIIVNDNAQPWQVYRSYALREPEIDHIDLIEVAPSFVGLKSYGARMHMPWLKDLPYPHDVESLTDEQFAEVERYCINDLDTTEKLYKELNPQMKLREQMSLEYGVDMRSKSDTQMAEQAFIRRLNLRRHNSAVPYSINYKMPEFITFDALYLQELAQKIQTHEYIMNQSTGHVTLPDFLGKDKVKLGEGTYQLGVGGIHSTHDKKVCYVANEDYVIVDIDAASYYPSIILNCNLIPQNTGQKFLDEYRAIYSRRIEAKKAGNKAIADGLKVPLNGSFGKMASRWSPLYSPDAALAITLTGQLTLLSLIEKLESLEGVRCLSANTDGIAMWTPKTVFGDVKNVVSEFEKQTGFEFEYTPYRVLAMKDVNNYFAVKTDKKIKTKGIYAEQSLSKNPNAQICSQAVGQWLAFGTPFEDTIHSSSIEGFISARSVTGGGVQGDTYLGKVVRWYMTTDTSLPPLTYAKNGNKVPKTEGARAAMIIDKSAPLPADLDYTWYIKEACRIASDIGAGEYLTQEQIALITPPLKIRKPRSKK